jgi:hypothetical protein
MSWAWWRMTILREGKAGGSQAQSQSGLHGETLSQTQEQQQKIG